MAEIDSLQIQISVDSKQATSGVESLIRTLDKLKKVERSFASSKTAKVINDITKAVKNAPQSEKIKCISQLATALKKLPETVHFPSNLGSEIKNLNESLNNLSDKNIGKLKDLSRGLKSLSKGKSGLKPSVGTAVDPTKFFRVGIILQSIRSATNAVRGFVGESMKYTEDLNLFTASMGEYAEEAKGYGEKVSNIMGIDPAKWMRAQGVFQMIAEGFGVASDRAYIMSKNLTQLSYDISSFANISVDEAIEKLTSGISGELEPLRRIGYDLSMARLKAEALTLGIHKNFNEMTQAEKSQLRYIAIMKQVTVAQGDMARTLEAPANQMRILSAMTVQAGRAIGNIFIPMLNAILPYAIAALNGIRALANGIASLFGFKLPKIDYSGITKGSSALGGLADKAKKAGSGLKGASDEAKKLKNNLLGIDELNIIHQDTPKSGGGGGGGGADVGDLGAFDFELPQYDFLKGLTDGKIGEAMKKLKEWGEKLAPVLALLAAALGALKWIEFIKGLSGLQSILAGFGLKDWLTTAGGALLFFAGAILFVTGAIEAVLNGMSWTNLGKMLLGMTGMITGIYLALIKINPFLAPIAAGFTAAATGLTLFWISMRDARIHGVNIINILGGTAGLVTLVGGLAVAMKQLTPILGQDFSGIIAPLAAVWGGFEMIKTALLDIYTNGLNSNNVILGIVGAIAAVTGAVIALNAAMMINPIFAAITGVLIIGSAVAALMSVNDKIQKMGEETYKSSEQFEILKRSIDESKKRADELAEATKNIKANLETLSDVQINNGVISQLTQDVIELNNKTQLTAGEEQRLKYEIEQLNELSNGKINLEFDETTGHVKQTADEIRNMIDAYMKEAEAKAISDLMTESIKTQLTARQTLSSEIKKNKEYSDLLRDAQERLSKIDPIKDPEAYGRVRSEVEQLAGAVDSSAEAITKGQTALEDATNATQYWKDKMEEAATTGVDFGTDVSSNIQKINDTAIDVANYMPVRGAEIATNLSNGINDNLHEDLFETKGDIIATNLVTGFTLGVVANAPGVGEKIKEWANKVNKSFEENANFQSFNEKAKNIVRGFKEGIGNTYADVKENMTTFAKSVHDWFTEGDTGASTINFNRRGIDVINGFKDSISTGHTASQDPISKWAKSVMDWFTTGENGVNKENFGKHGSNIIDGFKDKVGSDYIHSKQKLIDWAKGVKDWFVKDGGASKQTFEGFAKDVIDGFKDKVESLKSTVKGAMTSLADFVKTSFSHPNGRSLKSMFEDIGHDVMEGFKSGLEKAKKFVGDTVDKVTSFVTRRTRHNFDSHSPSRVFIGIGHDVVDGLRVGIESTTPEVLDSIDSMTAEMVKTHPKVEYQVDTSKVKFSDNSSLMGVATGSVTKQTDVAVSGFKEGMIEFYREYMEPTMREMAVDMKRQADKKEETVVQIGNRTVHDAVIEQREANGYSFISER